MNYNDYAIFQTIAKTSERDLQVMMQTFLQTTYGKDCVTATESYIIAEGKIPICLVAHLDTVFSFPPNEIYFDKKKRVIWSPQGLGADDRAGVFAIIKIIQAGFHPHIIFTTGEEKGGIGAFLLAKAFPVAPFNVKYLIQLDRQGMDDCVFYDCANKKFENYIHKFGFKTDWGSFSDISVICPQWQIAGVNLSVGYFREHTVSETLHTKGLMSTIDKVKRLLADAANIQPFEYIPDVFGSPFNTADYFNFAYPYSYGPEDDLPDNSRFSRKIKCYSCKKEYDNNDFIPVMSRNNPFEDNFYCYNCISDEKIGWCFTCGDAFEKVNNDDRICPICKKYKD